MAGTGLSPQIRILAGGEPRLLTGIGDLDFKSGDLTWSVTFPDGKLDYHATATSRHVTGTYKGKPVDITD